MDDPKLAPLYSVARRFVDVALRGDGSLLTPGIPVWSFPVVADLYERLVRRPGDPGEEFEARLRTRLQGAAALTVQLAAELLVVHLLPARDIGGEAKRALVETVLTWSPTPLRLPEDVLLALEAPVFDAGLVYRSRRHEQLAFLLEFFRAWKGLAGDHRKRALDDPAVLKGLAFVQPRQNADAQVHVLLHLVHPEGFEPIATLEYKRRIAQRLRDLVTEPVEDVDRQLRQIRAALVERFGVGFSFFDSEPARLWMADEAALDAFCYWIDAFRRANALPESEREEVVDVGRKLGAARAAVLAGAGDWCALLKAGFGSSDDWIGWRVGDSFLAWCEEDPKAAAAALSVLWQSDDPGGDGLRAFLDVLPQTVGARAGTRLSLAAYLLLGVDPFAYALYRRKPLEKGFELCAFPDPSKDWDEADLYRHTLAYLDLLRSAAAERGVLLTDRLEVAGYVQAVVGPRTEPPTHWSEDEQRALLAYRTGERDEKRRLRPRHLDPLAGIAARLSFDREWILRIERLLEGRGQIVLYGPPGTGKTWAARELAAHFAGDPRRVELVQLHAGSGYADLLEGFRTKADGSASVLVPGPLRRLARAAERAPGVRHVLVLDELNRANAASVMGELVFLLESRGVPLVLPLSQESFALPENVWIIATMSTADRSLTRLDPVLARRFLHVPFFPDVPPVEGLLRRWLQQHQPTLTWLADVVDEANRRIGDRHAALGPAPFLRDALDEAWVELVWEHAVMPRLEELFAGEEERLFDFRLAALRASVGAPAPREAVVPGVPLPVGA